MVSLALVMSLAINISRAHVGSPTILGSRAVVQMLGIAVRLAVE